MQKNQRLTFLTQLRKWPFWRNVWNSRQSVLQWPWQALQQLSVFLSHAWKVVLQLGLLVLVAMLVYLLWEECHKTVAVIGRIEAPEELQKKGYAPQVLGNHLTDALLAIDRYADDAMPHQHAISDFQQPDVTLTDGFSLRAALRFLKQTLHHPDIQISGDAIVDGDTLQLRARVVDARGEVHTLSQSGKTVEIETALNALAEQVMEVVDPVILGGYWLRLAQNSCPSKLTCDYSKVISQFQKVTATTPDNDKEGRKWIAWTYLGWGYVHGLRGEYKEQAEKLKLAHDYDPDNVRIYNDWCTALNGLKKYDEAIAKCRQAMELDSKMAFVYNNWGNALNALGKHEEAIELYRQAVELDPKFADA